VLRVTLQLIYPRGKGLGEGIFCWSFGRRLEEPQKRSRYQWRI